MPEVYSFGIDPVSRHSWSKNRKEIAMSPNNNEVQIHSLEGKGWVLKDSLTDHTQRVTGIDWCHITNKIVTCAADRNAYVWTKEGAKWKPTLVVLGITRAATCVKWSPKGDKFAVGSGNRSISVCYFDSVNNWWSKKKIRKPIRSTITCLDWHPNNQLLACGSTGFKARVYCAWMEDVDEAAVSTAWGSKLEFANMLAEFSNDGGAWVHGIRFSGSGNKLAWVSHNSSICVVDSNNNNLLTTLKTEYLPFVDVLWLSETELVTAGHDCFPVVYNHSNGKITFASKLDTDVKQAGVKAGGAMAHFRKQDTRGTTQGVSNLNSIHQNTLTQLTMHTGSASKVSKFSSSGADGKLVVWDSK